MNSGNLRRTDADNLEAFLSDLTELSAKHGIAIGDAPMLFVMEREDYGHVYKADARSVLSRA